MADAPSATAGRSSFLGNAHERRPLIRPFRSWACGERIHILIEQLDRHGSGAAPSIDVVALSVAHASFSKIAQHALEDECRQRSTRLRIDPGIIDRRLDLLYLQPLIILDDLRNRLATCQSLDFVDRNVGAVQDGSASERSSLSLWKRSSWAATCSSIRSAVILWASTLQVGILRTAHPQPPASYPSRQVDRLASTSLRTRRMRRSGYHKRAWSAHR